MLNSAAMRDARHIVHGNVDLAKLRAEGPTVMTAGKGVFVFDENGTPYLEGSAGMWCAAFGFGEEELVEAAIEQMRKLPWYHTVAYKSVMPAVDLAERLAALVPIADAKIYFALSGSEANDYLVKFVRYYNNAVGRPEKKKVIARVNGYHGTTLAATSLTGIPACHAAFDVPIPGILHTQDPHFYRHGQPGETAEEYTTRLADDLEALILREGPGTVAAFIAEPITGAGGVVIPPEGYYAKIQAVLDRHDVLFLADEVITGFLRTGRMFGSETMGIRPDTMTLAKGLTSAYQPLSALVLSPEIYAGMEKGSAELGMFAHGATYAGHPVACAVALKVLDLIERRDMAGHVARVSERFAARIRGFADHPLVGDTRVQGLMGAIELVADEPSRALFTPQGAMSGLVKRIAEERFQLIFRNLPCGDTCGFSPPLVITEAEVDEMFDRFGRALDAAMAAFPRD